MATFSQIIPNLSSLPFSHIFLMFCFRITLLDIALKILHIFTNFFKNINIFQWWRVFIFPQVSFLRCRLIFWFRTTWSDSRHLVPQKRFFFQGIGKHRTAGASCERDGKKFFFHILILKKCVMMCENFRMIYNEILFKKKIKNECTYGNLNLKHPLKAKILFWDIFYFRSKSSFTLKNVVKWFWD